MKRTPKNAGGKQEPPSRRRGPARRDEFLPRIVDAFVELGYRRTTTAELAARCGVRENELYRIWSNKKQMFLAAIDHVYRVSRREWREQYRSNQQESAARQLLASQARTRGESRLHRIVFSGLSEVDDPEIRAALAGLYRRFHKLLVDYIRDHRQREPVSGDLLDEQQAAWAMIGVASIFDIQHDLGIGSKSSRRRLLREVANALLGESQHSDG